MAVHNAGARRPQGGFTIQSRLLGQGFRFSQQPQRIRPHNAIGRRFGLNCTQLRHLLGRSRHNQFATLLVRNVALTTVGIKTLATLHAKLRLEGPLGVIDTGVNHFTVARAGACAKGICRLEQQDLLTFKRQLARNRQAHHPSPDHHCLYSIH